MSDFPDPTLSMRSQWFITLLVRAANPSYWLIGTLMSLLHWSLSEAGWVSERDAAYLVALWLGGLLGITLALSRFRGRWALACSLFLSLCFAAESIGHILPASPGVLLTSDWIWGMHVRLIALALRITGWWGALAYSEPIHDIGLFIVVLSLVAWNVSAWLAWGVGRWRNALAAVLPMGLMLGLNVHLDGQPLYALWLFLGVAVVLVARASFLGAHGDWERRQVDYPDGLGMDWAASALVLAFVIGAVARVGPLVGTPQGWRLINDWLLRTRAHVAETTGDIFADVNPPPVYRQPLVASAANLEQIGTLLDQRPDTVFWVTVSDPPPPPLQSHQPNPRPHYWRNAVFAAYLGTGWQRAATMELENAPSVSFKGRYSLNQHFEVTALHGEDLFAVNMPFSVTGEAVLRFLNPDHSPVLAGRASTTAYDVVSWATDVNADQLNTASDQYPDAIRAAYLQLPATLPQRVRDLAHQITSGAATPYAQALRLQTYLRETRPYRLDVPPPPSGQDAVDYFLFNAPGGFCSYYASAMAVMLRVEGIPARVVAGYTTGEFDYELNAYRVPASAAHAWVEVYFPDYGWVEFEPTAALSVFPYGETSTPLTYATPALPPLLESLKPLSASPWGLGLIITVLLIGGASLMWQWRLARRRTPRQQAFATYWAARRALGLGAPASTTPNEFLAAAATGLENLPQVLAALRGLTTLYVQAAFSPRPIQPDEARLAQSAWRRAWLARRRRRDLTQRVKPNR